MRGQSSEKDKWECVGVQTKEVEKDVIGEDKKNKENIASLLNNSKNIVIVQTVWLVDSRLVLDYVTSDNNFHSTSN